MSFAEKGRNVAKRWQNILKEEKLQVRKCSLKDKIDIRALKAFVYEKFPKDSPLRDTILRERDILEVSEFLPKMETWLNLLRTVG